MARIAPCVVAAAEYLGKRDAAELGDSEEGGGFHIYGQLRFAVVSTIGEGSERFKRVG